jgi:hypothetical protein
VSEDARRGDGAVLDFFDVGGADAAHGDFDEEFVSADAGDGDVLQTQIVHAAINNGTHGFGNVGHRGSFNAKTQRRKGARRIFKFEQQRKEGLTQVRHIGGESSFFRRLVWTNHWFFCCRQRLKLL